MNPIELKKGSPALVCLISVMLIVLAYAIISNTPTPKMVYDQNVFAEPYHADEGVWIATGKHFFQKFFLERDFSRETWEDQRFGTFGTTNPVLGKYIYGSWLFISGVVDKETNIPGYKFEGPLDWSKYEKTKPPQDVLNAARVPAKWMGILSAVILFLLVRKLARSWLLGCVTAVFFILQPQLYGQSQKAMMDIPVLFFSLLTLLVASVLLKKIASRSIVSISLRLTFLGFFYGLAMQVKLNSLLILATVIIWVLLEILWSTGITIRPLRSLINRLFTSIIKYNGVLKRFIPGGVAMGLMIALIFILLNPFLYRDTFKHAGYMFMFHKTVTEGIEVPEESKNNSLSKRWKALISVGLGRSSVQRQWSGLPSFIDKSLAFWGVVFGILIVWQRKNEVELKRGIIYLGIWGVLIAAGLLAWVPFRATRWYLPMAPIWALLESLGIFFLIYLIKIFSDRFKITST